MKSTINFNFSLVLTLLLKIISFLLYGCGGKYSPVEEKTIKTQNCKPVDKFNLDEIIYTGAKVSGRQSFSDVRSSVNSACMSCHMAPARSGGFTYIDSYKGEFKTISGQSEFYNGFFEQAEKIHEYIFHPDDNKRMPPLDRRKQHPEIFIKIGEKVQAWINAGKPDGSFEVSNTGSSQFVDPKTVKEEYQKIPRQRRDEIGDCTPNANVIGTDFWRDRKFASLETLPEDLSETDIISLDSFELAKKGTVAYNVEYPLWADNADKGRFIHLPVKLDGLKLIREKIIYDSEKQKFIIPENTRFYKNFYKKYLGIDGKYHFRRIETRIIVVRYPFEKSLMGSYKWDEFEQTAKIIDTPYRDGTPFKDTIYTIFIYK